jgi:ElaB/YqjD/DUF883 family membrane-anchored ribosome-binding protein
MVQQDKKITHIEEAEAFLGKILERGEIAEEEFKKHADTLEKYIKKHPVRSTLIAGVAGLVLGKLLSK